jgi:hypothetical protein
MTRCIVLDAGGALNGHQARQSEVAKKPDEVRKTTENSKTATTKIPADQDHCGELIMYSGKAEGSAFDQVGAGGSK